MTRLFIGTFVSEQDQQKLARLASANADLGDKWNRKLRWVKPEKLHMTWIFLGTVAPELLQSVSDMLSNLIPAELERNADSAPMQLVFDHAEIWPDRRRPRLLVLRPTLIDERIMRLARVLRTGLLEFYFEEKQQKESLGFKPHLTLARLDKKDESSKVVRVRKEAPSKSSAERFDLGELEGLRVALPVVLNLEKIALIESHVGKGAAYNIIHEVATVAAH